MKFFRVRTVSATMVACLIASAFFHAGGLAQERAPESSVPASAIEQSSQQPVPTLVRSTGALAGHASERLLLRFGVYTGEASHEPVWTEQQMVQLGAKGEYSVLLGAGSAIGLPQSLFVGGEPRWLGVQIGDSEVSRTLLTSVPYAMKAADADTLGGQSASSFVTREELATKLHATAAALASQAIQPFATPTGGGTTGSIPLWTSATALGNSALTQTGTGTAAKVGIATTTPVATLDVAGTMNVRGNTKLTNGIAATATTSVNSPTFQMGASSYSSATAAAVAQNFVWQVQAVGSNTATPSSKLGLLFGAGAAAPAATGLSIAPSGIITFAAKQTFPGAGGGTITGVTAGTGLKGGGTSGAVTLNLDTTKIPQLSSYNTFASGASFGGESSWYGSSTDWMMVVTNTSATAKGTILGQAAGTQLAIEGASPGGVGVEGASDQGVGVQAISNTTGTALRVVANGTGQAASMTSQNGSSSLTAANTGGGAAVYGTAASGYGGFFSNNSTYQPTVYAANAGNGNAGYFSNNSPGRVSVAGINNSTDANAIATYGTVANGKAVYGISTAGTGIYGTSTTGNGGIGYSASGVGVLGSTTSGIGVEAVSSASLSTSLKVTTNWIGGFVQQLGVSATAADVGAVPSLWADTGGNGGTVALAASGDNVVSGLFLNSSATYPTLSVHNYSTGGTMSNFRTLMAAGPGGVCGFSGEGNMTCTGQVKSVVTTGTARQVETYSVQSSENWIEDYGTGQLTNGQAEISLDPSFVDTANTAIAYHVFITPEGDAEPLYVTRKTATSFEVHESRKGSSAIAFDYRIVAKRRGVEAQRLVDVTEPIRAEIEAGRPRAPIAPIAPSTPSPELRADPSALSTIK